MLVAHNNIFVKDASGYASGLFNVAYAAEGFPTSPYDGPNGGPRTNSISLRFNTHVAFASTVDGIHAVIPYEFSANPAVLPQSIVPSNKVTVDSNAFVGFCPANDQVLDYRGTTALTAGFADISHVYSCGDQWTTGSNSVIGLDAYSHKAVVVKRTNTAVGARD